MNNEITEDGLTGTHGYVGDPPMHISANFAAGQGMVFVETDDMNWKRMKEADALEQKKRVIRCSYCTQPAISVDHCWPYLQEATYCDQHRDWKKHVAEHGLL